MLGNFISCGKKQFYHSCVKVLNLCSLAKVLLPQLSRGGMRVLLQSKGPKGRWRVLYKPPVEKRMAELQFKALWESDRLYVH